MFRKSFCFFRPAAKKSPTIKKVAPKATPPSSSQSKSSTKPSSSSKIKSMTETIHFFPNSEGISYQQSHHLPLLITMVAEQQKAIFQFNNNNNNNDSTSRGGGDSSSRFKSISVTFLKPSSGEDLTLKMQDLSSAAAATTTTSLTNSQSPSSTPSSTSSGSLRSLLLFHGTGKTNTKDGHPNKETFLNFKNFLVSDSLASSTNENNKTAKGSKNNKKQQQIKQQQQKQIVVSDRVFLTPSLTLALDFASISSSSSSSLTKTVFAFQVDFLTEDSLPVESEYGPVQEYSSSSSSSSSMMTFQEDKKRKTKAVCYSYVHPDCYQPCFGLLRNDNAATKSKEQQQYRIQCVGFVDFEIEIKNNNNNKKKNSKSSDSKRKTKSKSKK